MIIFKFLIHTVQYRYRGRYRHVGCTVETVPNSGKLKLLVQITVHAQNINLRRLFSSPEKFTVIGLENGDAVPLRYLL